MAIPCLRDLRETRRGRSGVGQRDGLTLEQLASIDSAAANLVRLRFFAGLKTTEAAEALGMSVRSAHDLWAYARSWLRRKTKGD